MTKEKFAKLKVGDKVKFQYTLGGTGLGTVVDIWKDLDYLKLETPTMSLKPLSELCNQKPLFEFEGFIVRPFDGWCLWIENPHGEGTTVMKQEFLGQLASMFERNF